MAAADTIRTLQLSANPKIAPAIKPPPEHTSVTPTTPAHPLQTTVAAGCGGGGVGGDAGREACVGSEGRGGDSPGPSVGKSKTAPEAAAAEGVTVSKYFCNSKLSIFVPGGLGAWLAGSSSLQLLDLRCQMLPDSALYEGSALY